MTTTNNKGEEVEKHEHTGDDDCPACDEIMDALPDKELTGAFIAGAKEIMGMMVTLEKIGEELTRRDVPVPEEISSMIRRFANDNRMSTEDMN